MSIRSFVAAAAALGLPFAAAWAQGSPEAEQVIEVHDTVDAAQAIVVKPTKIAFFREVDGRKVMLTDWIDYRNFELGGLRGSNEVVFDALGLNCVSPMAGAGISLVGGLACTGLTDSQRFAFPSGTRMVSWAEDFKVRPGAEGDVISSIRHLMRQDTSETFFLGMTFYDNFLQNPPGVSGPVSGTGFVLNFKTQGDPINLAANTSPYLLDVTSLDNGSVTLPIPADGDGGYKIEYYKTFVVDPVTQTAGFTYSTAASPAIWGCGNNQNPVASTARLGAQSRRYWWDPGNLLGNPSANPTGAFTSLSQRFAITVSGQTCFSEWAMATAIFANVTPDVVPAPPGAFALITPANGDSGVVTTPTLTWNAAPGAQFYNLRMASDSGFTQNVTTVNGLVGTSYTPATALGNGTYFWQVTAVTPAYVSPTGPCSPVPAALTTGSAVFSFTVGSAAPAAFSLTSPASGATGVDAAPNLQWGASAGAATYTVEVATDAAFAAVVRTQPGLTGTSWLVTPSLAAGTQYFWRVTAVNGTGNRLAGNAPFSFTTAGAAPAAFSLIAPADNALIAKLPVPTSTRPDFSWTASSGSPTPTYTLQITTPADTAFASPLLTAAGLTNTSFTPSQDLNWAAKYRWRVQAVNSAGTTTATPTSRLFGIKCQADVDNNGTVGGNDLTQILTLWGTGAGGPASLDGQTVGAGSLTILLVTYYSAGPPATGCSITLP
ncbi:MAG: hypothetical protein IBJ11_00100 [Phycisphaerales bacterium]|nr:hypothetical protein [Phycisphaerales bacterium]